MLINFIIRGICGYMLPQVLFEPLRQFLVASEHSDGGNLISNIHWFPSISSQMLQGCGMWLLPCIARSFSYNVINGLELPLWTLPLLKYLPVHVFHVWMVATLQGEGGEWTLPSPPFPPNETLHVCAMHAALIWMCIQHTVCPYCNMLHMSITFMLQACLSQHAYTGMC